MDELFIRAAATMCYDSLQHRIIRIEPQLHQLDSGTTIRIKDTKFSKFFRRLAEEAEMSAKVQSPEEISSFPNINQGKEVSKCFSPLLLYHY